jgi:hypothetical protein
MQKASVFSLSSNCECNWVGSDLFESDKHTSLFNKITALKEF